MSKKFSGCTAKVQWHEGMLLSPQHFQYADERFESLLFTQSQFQAYTSWGIINQTFDESLLNQGLLSISELSVIFPDGTITKLESDSVHENQRAPLELNLKTLDLKNAVDVDIFLCLATKTTDKYISKTYQNVVDVNTDDNVIDLPVLQPKIFLNPNQCPEGCIGFVLFKVHFDGKQFFKKEYMPPCFNVVDFSPFVKKLANIILNLRQKATYLVNKNYYSTSATLSRDTQDILKPVISSLCLLEPLLGLVKIHPERFFEELTHVTSILLPLNTTEVPSVLASYDPYAPDDGIRFYLNLLEKTVSTIQQRYISISFHQQDRLFYLHMQPGFLVDQIYLGFRNPTSMTDYQLQQWVEEAIIACDDQIDLVTTKRITGAARVLLDEEDITDIIPHAGTLLYKLQVNDSFIKAKQNLNIFNPGDTEAKRPLDITLYIKQSES